MEKENMTNLIEKIDTKIAELEKQENPNELLRRALIKRDIIKSSDEIKNDDLERIFNLIKQNL